MFEIAEDMSSTHSNVKPAAAILLTGNREIAEEVDSRTNFPTGFLFQVDSPPLPLPPLPDNERTEVLTAPQEKE